MSVAMVARIRPAIHRPASRQVGSNQTAEVVSIQTAIIMRALQLSGGRRLWRVSEDDLAAYLERCYQETQERIAAGTVKAESLEGED